MANLILPFSARKIDENVAYFQVMKIPFSPFIAYLSSNALYIRNSANINHNVAVKISRSQKSLQNHGPNQWIQYIDRYHISFGTKSGLVNVFRFTDLTSYSKKIENIFFASTFNCYKHLSCITPNNELFFIKIDNDENFNTDNRLFHSIFGRMNEKVHEINITELNPSDKTIELLPVNYIFDFAHNTIFNTVFYHRLNKPKLAAIVQSKPCFIPITPSMLKSKKMIQPYYFLVENATMLSVNPTLDYIAAALSDSSVVFMSTKFQDSKPVPIVEYENGVQVIFMRWTYDDENLIIIGSNGCVTLFEMPTYSVYNMYVPDLIISTADISQSNVSNTSIGNSSSSNNLIGTTATNNSVNNKSDNSSNLTNNNVNNSTNNSSINSSNVTNNSANNVCGGENGQNKGQFTVMKPLNVCRVVSIDYDEESKSFYFIKREDENQFSLHSVELATLQKRFCFTSSHVLDKLMKIIYPLKIYPTKYVIPFSIKEKIYDSPGIGNRIPIDMNQQSQRKIFISASNNQIQIDDNIFTFNEDDTIQGIQFLEGYLFVFVFSSKMEETRLVLFDENLKQKKVSIVFAIKRNSTSSEIDQKESNEFIYFPHSVHNVTSNYINQIAASCHTMYTFIKMNMKKLHRKNKNKNKNFDDESSDVDLLEGLNLDDDEDENDLKNLKYRRNDSNEYFNSMMNVKVLDENENENESSNNNNADDDDYTFTIKTFSVRQQLKNVISCTSQIAFLHFTNDTGVFLDSYDVFKNVRYAFYEPYSDVTIIQSPHTYILVKETFRANFKGVACFSDMAETFSLYMLTNFGDISYVGTLFMPFLLIHNFRNSNDLLISRLKKVCPNDERFNYIISFTVSTVIVQNYPKEQINDNIRPIFNSIQDQRAAKILQNAIEKIKEAQDSIKIVSSSSSEYDNDDDDDESSSSSSSDDDNKNNIELIKHLLACDFRWEKYFKYFDIETKEIILMYINPISLENLLLEIGNDIISDNVFNQEEKKNFILKLIKDFQFLRAFKISDSLKINFALLVKEVFYRPNNDSNSNDQIDLKKIIKKIEHDKKNFNMKDDNGLLRFMGSTFGATNLFIFSFAVFLVLKEQSKIELMLMTNADQEMDNKIAEFIKKYPNSEYSKFLLSLPNSMFKENT